MKITAIRHRTPIPPCKANSPDARARNVEARAQIKELLTTLGEGHSFRVSNSNRAAVSSLVEGLIRSSDTPMKRVAMRTLDDGDVQVWVL